ncbi:[acyl-carrier-protein] S-malonyltransferase [Helicobacter cholecystus]|uniref:Malonyl CoA-acyl carrier protein transacylase n=1 Tax=Helicobacter cholecystus TaxID=45498 RepID=A0A3D8IZ44_9HELI|nr:ACP S-malonyltransferase [Helicobacter cholecystus]RDU69904.1 [acyl-carrier-protein] S-malonyltransferase [Helicobacter cholecystus]VEJ25050.1 ACP S-malonyltransferase [Helicobacter cholecystus]
MKYAFIFPGQGSQSKGMGKDFYDNFSIAKELIEQASDTLGFDFKYLLFEENDKLNLTQYTQPCIFLVSYIAHTILQNEFPLLPNISLGHSLGEVSAVAMAKGMSFENALKLTYERGGLMAKACEGKDAGMMVVVGLEDGVLEEFCTKVREEGKSVWCANYNADGQVVLAGKKADLGLIEADLKSLGAKRTLLLPMSVASHCPMLEEIYTEFESLLEELLEDEFVNPILSNATLQSYTQKPEAKTLLTQQLVMPVLYKQSIQKILGEIDGFIEFGNGSVLKGLNKRLSDKPTYSVSDVTTLKETIQILQ